MRIVFFFIVILSFSACKKDHAGCFDSEGKEVVSTRELPAFVGIDVNDKFDVHIIQSATNKNFITITAGQNVLSGISTEWKDSIIYIRNKNRCNFVRNMTKRIAIEIHVDRINYIAMREAAKVFCHDTISTPSVYIYSNSLEDLDLTLKSEFVDARGYNSGAVTLRGKAQLVACTIEDVCVLNTETMEINDMYVYHYGRKHASVNGKKIIGAYIYNSANVYYSQVPEIKLFAERIGSGNLIKK